MNDDLISRQAAIKNLARIAKNCARSDPQMALMGRCIYMIENMSSIQPEQKTGRWIERTDTQNDVYYVCSNCKEEFTLIEGTPTDNLYNYCPNCGQALDWSGEDE